MKPLKATRPLARWILRFTLLIFFYVHSISLVKGLNFKDPDFYFAAVYLISGILLVIGAFLSDSSLTVIVSWLIFLLLVFQIIKSPFGLSGSGILNYLVPASIAFFFLSTGNDS